MVTVYLLVSGLVFALIVSQASSRDYRVDVPWSDTLLHFVVPALAVIAWTADSIMAVNPPVPWSTVGWVLVYPSLWLPYTLLRGADVGWYPYFFLDEAQVGGGLGVAAYCALVLVIFVAITAVLVAVNRALWRRARDRRGSPSGTPDRRATSSRGACVAAMTPTRIGSPGLASDVEPRGDRRGSCRRRVSTSGGGDRRRLIGCRGAVVAAIPTARTPPRTAATPRRPRRSRASAIACWCGVRQRRREPQRVGLQHAEGHRDDRPVDGHRLARVEPQAHSPVVVAPRASRRSTPRCRRGRRGRRAGRRAAR